MKERIVAKVAKVLDNRTVAISAGADKGVRLGMKFLISSASTSDVFDPDTDISLGKIAIPKIQILITRVDAKYSIGETYEYTTINLGGSVQTSNALGAIFQPPKLVKKYKTFEIEDNQKKTIEREKSIVLIGDIAEEIDSGD